MAIPDLNGVAILKRWGDPDPEPMEGVLGSLIEIVMEAPTASGPFHGIFLETGDILDYETIDSIGRGDEFAAWRAKHS